MIREILLYFCGFALGFGIAGLVYHPIRQYNKGYSDARKVYHNWHDGFEAGWNGAMSAIYRLSQSWLERNMEDEDK